MVAAVRKSVSLLTAAILTAGCLGAARAEADSGNGTPEPGISIQVTESIWRTGDYLYRVTEDGTAELTEYTGMAEDWEIPGEIGGYPVTSIGERCFSNQGDMHFYTDDYPDYLREYIRTVTVPEGIVSIGDYAFEDCFNLTEVVLPASLRRIGEGAFSGCDALTQIGLPEGLTELGAYAFRDCRSLSSISLPAGLKIAGANPFAGCVRLKHLDVSPDHPYFRYDRGMLYDRRENRLVSCVTEAWGVRAELPEGLRAVGESAMTMAPYQEIILPESLTEIGAYAFSECTDLREMTIPAGVETIGGNPFRGCSLRSLKIAEGRSAFAVRDDMLIDDAAGRLIAWLKIPAVTGGFVKNREGDELPEEIEADGVRMRLIIRNRWETRETVPSEDIIVPDGIREIGAYAFYLSAAENITLPESVETIGEGAFEGCESLEECRLPAGIREISDRAFRGCMMLEEVTVPEGVISVGAYAFSGSRIQEMRLPSSVEVLGAYAFAQCEAIRKIELSPAMTKIPKGAFCDSRAEEITIPEGITEIGAQAFARCETLTAAKIPEGITRIPEFCFYDSGIHEAVIPDGVIYIGDHAFRTGEYAGSNLENIRIPGSVRYIGNYAFAGGRYREITVPATLTAMGEGVFSGCGYLQQVTLEDGLTAIPESMFSSCEIESIEIPDSVSYIGEDAFWGCYRLSAVKMPAGRTEIGGNPFAECGELRSLTLSDDHPNLKMQGNLLIDVPGKRVIAWLPLREETACAVPDGIEIIGNGAFHGPWEFSEITLPDSLRVIGDYAFAFLNLESVLRLPDGLEEIGKNSMGTHADTMHLPKSLKTIGTWAFGGIEEVRIPESVERIGKEAFGSSVKRIVFPDSPVVLEGCPFAYECSPEIVLPENHPTLEMAGGNLYSREDRRLIALLTDEPIKEGTLEIGEEAVRTSGMKIPDSVRLIRIYRMEWTYGLVDYVYAVPGSAAEAASAHWLTD